MCVCVCVCVFVCVCVCVYVCVRVREGDRESVCGREREREGAREGRSEREATVGPAEALAPGDADDFFIANLAEEVALRPRSFDVDIYQLFQSWLSKSKYFSSQHVHSLQSTRVRRFKDRGE